MKQTLQYKDLHVYCPMCDDNFPAKIEQIRKDELNEAAWGDIVCSNCALVIATLSSEKEGYISFIPLTSVGDINHES